jgi:glycosyltransferase involved in cell wall biosynthesis
MNASSLPHQRIAFVSTRDLDQLNGRTAILVPVIRALRRHHQLDILPLRSVMQTRRPRDVAGAVLAWGKSLLRGRPLPLQCLLYASAAEAERLAIRIRDGHYDVVYLDTVRCQILLRALRRLAPDIHVVADFDDLMSRRAAFLARHGMPFLSGHVGPQMPAWLRWLIEVPLARLITAYEAATLPAAENEVVRSSDVTVLLSPVERRMLEARSGARVLSIPPAVPLEAPAWRRAEALRFVFIGSDRQLQNRTAIDALLEGWRRLAPATELHIYGRQVRPVLSVPGVVWHGFVDDLAEVYQPGSIALVPATVAGGIKTKVAEAWAWGCPVLGNEIALEGLEIGGYPLMLPLGHWDPLITDPAAHFALWARAARQGSDFVRDSLAPQISERAWDRVVMPALSPLSRALG